MRRNGCHVIEVHEPFWERFRDKSRGFGGALQMVVLAMRLALAYLRLITRTIPRLRSTDAVVIGYIGQLDMLTVGALARAFRVPVIFNPLVTLTDTVTEDRMLVPSGSAAARLIWVMDWLAMRLASLVITDTNQNAEYLRSQLGVPPCKIHTVDVGADEGVFRPAWRTRDQADHLHVLFYGKMIPLHGVGSILGAIRMLDEAGETDINFEIIGSGQQADLVTDFLKEYPQAPVVYRPCVAYPRLAQRIASADCVLGIFGSGSKAGRVVPNKVFQALAVGAPVITRDSPAVRDVLSDGVSALLVPPGDASALATAIQKMRDPQLRARLGCRGHEAYQRRASDMALASEMSDILSRALGERIDAELAGRGS
jgi:glycosyltransferase involved in cell wall biosynthesis